MREKRNLKRGGPLISLAEFAELVDISYERILVWYRQGKLPEPLVNVHQPRWSRAAVDRWLAGEAVTHA
jgi:hypothetical protein